MQEYSSLPPGLSWAWESPWVSLSETRQGFSQCFTRPRGGGGRRISAEPKLRPQRPVSGCQPAKRTKSHHSPAVARQIDWVALMFAFEQSVWQ